MMKCARTGRAGIEGITQQPPTPQPLNVKFENLNATISKKEGDIRHILSILYNLGIFRNFLSTLKKS
jgi:hypothetical protein